MLERETELIKQIVLESTINGRNAVKLNEVVAAGLPRGIKAFMIAHVAGMIEDDLRQSARLRKVTEGISSTIPAERTLLHSLALELTLTREEFTKLTEDTIHFLENYLCRPQWTLGQLMFEKQETITFEQMIRKFEYVADYSYYGVLAERHARRKEMKEITAPYFKNLIARIDEEIVKRHTPRELALLTKPIFDFLLLGDPSITRPIPLGALLLFYEDKNLINVKTYIERICQVRSRSQLSMGELIEIIEDLYNVETTVQKEVEESEQEILSPLMAARDDERASTTSSNSPAPAEEAQADLPTEAFAFANAASSASESVPDVKTILDLDTATLAQDIPDPVIAPPPAINAGVLVEYARAREAALNAPRAIQRSEATEAPVVPNGLPDVHSILTEEQRATFIRTVFQDDENYYSIFLASINKAPTWRDAQLHLRELFELKRLDILAPDVIAFTDAMHSRYDPSLRKR